jgi:membrane protein YqaA with SNARE-associated domain/membrane-associated phospholipid phosphatase
MWSALIELVEWTKDFFMQNGAFGLFILAFAEASFFPIPPDVVLIPLSLISPKNAIYYSCITAASSTLGGIFGYIIGVRAGRPLLLRFAGGKRFKQIEKMFGRYGGWAVAIAGFTPIPYKIFTIASGVFRMKITTFTIAALLSRSIRFLIEGTVIMVMGENALVYINKVLGPGSFIFIAAAAAAYCLMKKKKISMDLSNLNINNYWKKYIKRFGKFGVNLVSGFILAIFFGLLFFKIGLDSSARWLRIFDNKVLLAVKSLNVPAIFHTVRVINFLFQPHLIIIILVAILFIAWKIGRRKLFLFMTIISMSGSFLIQWGLKPLFQRPRISPFEEGLAFLEYGFPSGTMLVSTAVIGYIVFLLTHSKVISRSKPFIIMAAVIILFLIGFSRVFTGVSFPTDVIAGFLMGAIWVIVCVLTTNAYE